MMRHGLWALACVALALGTGCADEKKTPTGELGENCTRAADCGKGLSCVSGVCVNEGMLGGDAGGDIVTETRGAEGESCTRRGDCQAGLACFEQVCIEEGTAPEGSNPGEAGGRNETCVTHGDCKSGLGCYASRCREKDADLTVTGKSCVAYECREDADCCATFQPYPEDTCAVYLDYCQNGFGAGGIAVPDPTYCLLYEQRCECNESCLDNECVQAECSVDGDCGFGEFCVGNRCVSCETDDDCSAYGPSFICNVNGECEQPCVRDEQCGTLEQCKDGECTYVGCLSDLQCKAMGGAGAQLAMCQDGTCVTPCEADAECGSTQKCDGGACRDIGCTEDTECRYILGAAYTSNYIVACVDEEQ